MTGFKYTVMTFIGGLTLILLPGIAANADELILRVNNIEEAGEIHIAIYDDAAAFEADRGERGSAAPSVTQRIIETVEPGWSSYR